VLDEPSRAKRLLVSLVVPTFNEAENAEALVERFREIASTSSAYDFELIVVDDGSNDETVGVLTKNLDPRERWTVIRLSRNFGSHYAISAGLAQAQGDSAIVLGADLQEPLDLASRFIEAWRHGHDVVWGIRASRAHSSGLSNFTSRMFSRLFHRYSEIKSYPAEGPSGVLVSRAVMDVVCALPERNRNILGLIAWTGFASTRIEYEQVPRRSGATKWTQRKLARLALDSFVQFSSAPIKIATLAGFALASVGFLYAAFLIARVIFGAAPPEGWTTVVVLLLVLGGFQLIVLGIFGEYLWRATDEARRRPVYLIRDVYRSDFYNE
jgi:dolichol-phosphate mannosyltransferase